MREILPVQVPSGTLRDPLQVKQKSWGEDIQTLIQGSKEHPANHRSLSSRENSPEVRAEVPGIISRVSTLFTTRPFWDDLWGEPGVKDA